MPERTRIVITAGVPIPTGTVTQRFPQTGMKYQRMLRFCQDVHPTWVKWTFSSSEECQNAYRYLRYFFKDRDQIEVQAPRKAMMRLVRGCFILMRTKSKNVERTSRTP